jgi:hypothetical protein
MVSAFGGILVMIGFMMIAGSANDCDGACMEYANTLGEMALIIFLGLTMTAIGGIMLYIDNNGER